VAHALLQARDDIARVATGLPADVLWRRPGTAAPAGFHIIHMAGALDRLFTYARGESLDDRQKADLRAESLARHDLDGIASCAIIDRAIDAALDQLRATDPASLGDERRVGRAALPSTVLGLLFHAAEHTTRHAGQCITTIKALTVPEAGASPAPAGSRP
jgi:hypothetical protein